MRKKISNDYKFLLKQFSFVNEYLSDISESEKTIHEIVVSFCTVIEKMIKIKLHKKNPVLVYEIKNIKDANTLTAVIKNKDTSIKTVKFREALARYKLLFDKDFSDDEVQAILDVYNIRNIIIHGFVPDKKMITDEENVIKKMGIVWESFTKIIAKYFGDGSVKLKTPEKKYSKFELENVLMEEVKKKIENYNYGKVESYSKINWMNPVSFIDKNECPRCGAYELSNVEEENNMYHNVMNASLGKTYSKIYKCSKCNLELTTKEYEIAQNIKRRKEMNVLGLKS